MHKTVLNHTFYVTVDRKKWNKLVEHRLRKGSHSFRVTRINLEEQTNVELRSAHSVRREL